MKIKSITLKLCILLMILMSSISVIIGVWSIVNTNKIVQKEIGKMNSAVLNEIADNISILLSNVEEIGDNIVEDNKLVKILGASKSDIINNNQVNKEADKYVEVTNCYK